MIVDGETNPVPETPLTTAVAPAGGRSLRRHALERPDRDAVARAQLDFPGAISPPSAREPRRGAPPRPPRGARGRVCGPECLAHREPPRRAADDEHASASGGQNLKREQSERPRADDGGRFAGTRSTAFDGASHDRQRLGQQRVVIGGPPGARPAAALGKTGPPCEGTLPGGPHWRPLGGKGAGSV